jgi:quaternary ammonium compound-resistance protein SugE
MDSGERKPPQQAEASNLLLIVEPGNHAMTLPWILLAIAGLLEIGWAVGLKYTDGFSRLWPSLATVLGMIASFFFLAQAVRSLPVGTAYAIWTGIGAAGTAVLGIVLLGESASWPRLACLAVVVAGIVGLKLTSGQ